MTIDATTSEAVSVVPDRTPEMARSVSVVGARLMKAADFDAQLSAQAVRTRAQAKADDIVKNTLERATKIEGAARDKGERLGLERYAAAMLELESARTQLLEHAEPQLIQYVFSVVRQLLPSLPANLVTESMVLQLIRRESRARGVQLRVSPSELEFALSRCEQWRNQGKNGTMTIAIEVKPDAALEPGTCVMKSEFGTVTARIREQLDVLEQNALAAISLLPEGALDAAKPKPRKPRRVATEKSQTGESADA
jgi:flagellar biosynthesis/type III secretory pathway protein FliH